MEIMVDDDKIKSYWKLNPKDKAQVVFNILKQEYPEVETPLNHNNVYELLIATILSPQTTDELTNKVTPVLFEKYDEPQKLADAEVSEVQELISRVNYYKNKSKYIISAGQMIISDFENKVPYEMSQLIKIPGVGRKVANVVISEWYAKKPNPNDARSNDYSAVERGSILPEGFVVDTHVLRVTKGLGITEHSTPVKVEKDLMELFPREDWNDMSLRFIFHGRQWAQAKNPKYKEHPIWSRIYP